MIPKVFRGVFCQNLHALLRWLSKCGRLHHIPINSVYQSTKWTCLKLIGNLSMDMYIYLNWLIYSFVNDFRALVSCLHLCKIDFPEQCGWQARASTMQEGSNTPFRAVLNSP